MLLYNTSKGIVIKEDERWFYLPDVALTDCFQEDNLLQFLTDQRDKSGVEMDALAEGGILAPIADQEVWAAGVTYYRSRTARMEESSEAGGSDFYDRVYHADRPELFFKATAHRVVGHGKAMQLRSDSSWMVPEPELTLMISNSGKILGYTIGNDLSSRDIEGENPLYLPQAKTFDGCAAIGPAIYVAPEPIGEETTITIQIVRENEIIFEGSTDLSQMKKKPEQLVEYLFRACSFPAGCFLMTGTGIVPPDDFTLASGDTMNISIEPIGTLRNVIQ